MLLIACVMLMAACATAPPDPAATTTESDDFTVTAQPGTWRNQPHVQGYIYNKRGLRAKRVLLRVEALDGTGAVVASDLRHLDRDVPSNDRAFYQVPAPRPAPAYRVQVYYVFWSSGGGGSGAGGGI